MIFINADTLEYPRYEGDIALDPNANWQPVTEVPMPAVEDILFLAVEIKPILSDGLWLQQFMVRLKTDQEILESQKPLNLIMRQS
jgi:hypothetical protein